MRFVAERYNEIMKSGWQTKGLNAVKRVFFPLSTIYAYCANRITWRG